MAIIKKTANNKCWDNVEEREALYTVDGNVKLLQALWKKVWRFLRKLKKKNSQMIQQFLSWVYIQRKQNTNLKRYMHPNIHSSIIYYYQDMEAT